MYWGRRLKLTGVVLIALGGLGIAVGLGRFFADPDRLVLWKEMHSAGPLWLVEPQEEPTSVKAPTWRPGAHAFMERFPLPPTEGARRGLWLRNDAGTVFYEFDDGWRTQAVATAGQVRDWAAEWPGQGWDAGLVVVGVVLAMLGLVSERRVDPSRR